MTPPAESKSEILERFLRAELAPRPGRLQYVLRITALTILTVIICETYQTPLIAYSAYIVFFASKEESGSTLVVGIGAGLSITIAVFVAIGMYMLSAGEPGLRFPLMAIVVFGAMFFSRASALGMFGFLIGFLITMSLTLIDNISPGAPQSAGNLLTRMVLWLWVVVMIPVTILVIGNIIAGRDPMNLFRSEISERLRLAALKLSGRGAAGETQPPSVLLTHLKMSALFRPKLKAKMARYHRIIALLVRLDQVIREFGDTFAGDPRSVATVFACSDVLLSAERFFQSQETVLFSFTKVELPPGDSLARVEIVRLTNELADVLVSDGTPVSRRTAAKKSHAGLLRPDALTNPEYVRYALKATIAIFTAYITYNLLAWPDIVTCLVTCFFVALGSFGETAHKMTLRLSGAIIGGVMGLATVVFIMPYVTTITALCIILAIASLFAGWISTSSERLSYAGLQIAMAFFFSVLVGYGPSVSLSEARDRVVGILLGNIIVFVVFSTLWPTSALVEAKKRLAVALRKMGDIVTSAEIPDDEAIALQDALVQARELSSLDIFEPGIVKRDAHAVFDSRVLDAVQRLCPPIFLVRELFGEDAGPAAISYRSSLHSWLSSVAAHLETGEAIGPPPRTSEARYGELDLRVEYLARVVQGSLDLKQAQLLPQLKGAA